MKAILLASAASAALALEPTSYLTWTADSFIRHGVEPTFHYTQATLYKGYEFAYELTKNETYTEWYRDQVDSVVADDGTIKDWNYTYYSLDDYRVGNCFIWWYEKTGEEKYKKAADIIRSQLDRHPRTPTGGFWHRQPVYPNQMWLDGIFSK
jgi:rhamnogalacturonyl hydrolase YesR